MFHANAWGYPYLATLNGSEARLPRPASWTRESLLDAMVSEKVNCAGVPTIWMGILQQLAANPAEIPLSMKGCSPAALPCRAR
jgi:fatty-acyl-CoA synthase